MIPEERRKYGKLHPAKEQILRDICTEAACICAGIQIAAHVQGRHHLNIHLQMRPPGQIVSLPDSSVAMHSDIRSPGEQENTFLRKISLKRL